MSLPGDDAAPNNAASSALAQRALWCLPLIVVPLVIWGSPLVAIVAGVCLSIAVNQPVIAKPANYGKLALQSAIVLLGFNLDAQNMWQVSQSFAAPIAVYVVVTLGAGIALGRLMGVDSILSRLIAAGTAICGGTAIASLSPVLRARGDQIAVALTIVFFLNMLALVIFPTIGEWLELSQTQFGIWSALAVHDTSSVVAVAAVYGQEAAEVATTAKLGRTLWLIPLVLVFSLMSGEGKAKIRIPGFILLFILASIAGSLIRANTEIPALVYDSIQYASKSLIVIALFFFGLECTRATLRNLRGRVVLLALLLWTAVVPLTLLAAMKLG